MTYNNNTKEFLSKLLEAWDKNSVSYTFMQSRFHNFVNDSPRETLDTLFFEVYLQHPVLSNFTQLRSFITPQSMNIYKGISNYLPYIKVIKHDNIYDNIRFLISREVRFLCREVMINALKDVKTQPNIRIQLFKTLRSLHLNPGDYTFDNDINPQEVIDLIPYYLEGSDLLAELPYFSGVYFTASELAPLWESLQQYEFKPDDEIKIDIFFDLSKKGQVLMTLENFIYRYSDSPSVKKAYAVYITLGEVIPWAKHPFIRRLLGVSYQEAITLMALQN